MKESYQQYEWSSNLTFVEVELQVFCLNPRRRIAADTLVAYAYAFLLRAAQRTAASPLNKTVDALLKLNFSPRFEFDCVCTMRTPLMCILAQRVLMQRGARR